MAGGRACLGAGLGICVLLAAALPAARAAEWDAGTGDFGLAANWADGSVPDGASTAVNIANGGTAQIDLLGSYTIGPLMLGHHAGEGSIDQSGGYLATRRIIIGGDDISGGSGRGFYRIADGTLKSVDGEIWIGSKGGEGTMEISGSSLVSSASWVVVGRDGASGHLHLSGNAELEVLSGNVPVGCNSNGFTSTLEIGGSARMKAKHEIWVGWLGNQSNHGIMRLSGHASASTGDGMVVGRGGARGTLEVAGNSALDVGGYLVCGANPGGSGEISIRDEAHVHAGKQVWVGWNGASGRILVEGGCLTGHAVPGEDPSGAGIAFRNDGELSIKGGKVSTPGFVKLAGRARILFDGGMLRATGNTTAGGFFVDFSDEDLWIGPRGLDFDTKSLTIEVAPSLGGEGKLSKHGTGTLVLQGSAGHAGDTEIIRGKLVLASPILSDAHRVILAGEGSRLRLEHGQTDRVAKLVIDGVVLPAGRYEAPGNPGDGTEIPQLEGSGVLEAGFGPGDLTFGEWLTLHELEAGFDADSDGDGIANGVEHVFGSDPHFFTPTPLLQPQEDGQSLLVHPLAAVIAADVTYAYEWSRDLKTWHRSGDTDPSGMRVDITAVPAGSVAEARYRVLSGSSRRLFGRVAASLSSPP